MKKQQEHQEREERIKREEEEKKRQEAEKAEEEKKKVCRGHCARHEHTPCACEVLSHTHARATRSGVSVQ